jgi:outer membrane receptor protein involved in Fe transport
MSAVIRTGQLNFRNTNKRGQEHMESSNKILLTPVAGAIATALSPAQQALAQDQEAAGDRLLEEVIVTATKRTVSVQDIPATIQALTQENLQAMGAKGMDDYSRFIPSINVLSFGAGSSTVVFRGAITGQGFIAQSTSSVYLDEISVTTTGSQPSIRMVDIERVEALSGPQGTLYGSDAQAGTLRIITNKPEMNVFESVLDLEVRGGSKSDPSYRGSLVFNIPLIDDTLAVRLVGFADHDGGFIDNVFGHVPDTSTTGVEQPAGYGTLDNAAAVEENWNDADITGGRIILAWEMSDNWYSTFTALTQNTEVGALNDYDPFVGDLQTTRFHNEYRDDEYQMYSWVLDGDLGFAQLVAAVNYYDREIEALYDITAYAHYWAALYCHDSYYTAAELGPYYWTNPDTGYVVWWPVYCQGESVDSDFLSSYYSPAQQDKFTTEVRLSAQGDRFDWIAGFYYEESNDSWQAPFATPTLGGNGDVNIYQNSASLDFWEFYFSNYYGSPASYPEATSHWYSQSSTDWEQKAVFGEFTWHINDAWDLTLGGRWFERTNTNYYIVDHPGDIGLHGEPDTGDFDSRQYRLNNNNQPPPHTAEEEEFIPKIALAWTFSDDQMVYGLYTQGKRPGGVNRARGQPFFPRNYTSDLMDNYEAGYRSTFAGGAGRLNVTGYYMEWDEYQIELVDPSQTPCDDPADAIPGVCGQPWQQVVANAGKAHIAGVMTELDYAFTDDWRFGGNIEFIDAKTDSTIDLNGDGINNITKDLRLPVTPEIKGSAWLDYTQDVSMFGGSQFFGRAQVSYTGDSVSILEPRGLDTPNPQFTTPSYTIADILLGYRGNGWEVTLFFNNITDERAIYTIEDGMMEWSLGSSVDGREHTMRAYTNRPREFGLRYSKQWGG